MLIKDAHLFKKIEESYEKNNWAVMGPNIFSVGNQCYSNPIQRKANFGLLYNLFSLIKSYRDILVREWNKHGSDSVEVSNNNYEEPQEDCMLHGAFLVFSEQYLLRFPNGIYPQNSFYMEENILCYICRRYNLKMFYEPSIFIEHLHTYSISKQFNDNMREKQKFVIMNHKNSKKTLIKLILMTKFNIPLHW